jgi:hypothetical protein
MRFFALPIYDHLVSRHLPLMNKRIVIFFWKGALLMELLAFAVAEPARGPLRVHPTNPRYFTDGSGRAVYLTGSHTWSNLQDIGPSDPPKPLDFIAYLDFLQKHHHNFIRLWRWEMPKFRFGGNPFQFCEPHPWKRTGPGLARDGKPKFDLTQFNRSYFDRLRQRVEAAGKRGIYVSIMLFEGGAKEWWEFHPFHPDNNVNGIDGGRLDYYTLKRPRVLALQEDYVRKVIDSVNNLDNVLYEICNEAGAYSTDWQYHMIRFIKAYEATKSKQHPVGMTFQYATEQRGTNTNLFQSPADWISPNPEGGYMDDPPPADGRKVVLNDTDHLWGEGGNVDWVWRSFLRGHHPLFMDRIKVLTDIPLTWHLEDIPGAEEIRRAMGATRKMANRINLAEMRPLPDLSSTRYCLANAGKEYLVYAPGGGEITVELPPGRGSFFVEWMHPVEGSIMSSGRVAGGGKRAFKAPFQGAAILHIRVK